MKIFRVTGREGRVTIPCDLRTAAGMTSGTIVSFEMVSEDAILVRREQLKDQPEARSEMPSLKELLESLTDSQRGAAQYYLSILCSSQGAHGGRDCV
ncbi:MAG: AbrB/MazE/SpoVT family DNA-binding domain-containing protein [Oscillospiraceae bacterium]|nr:AbrB/MazE/SpoVT family DNA-binding domain-containing protein [Oscillospiraceae bacterium]